MHMNIITVFIVSEIIALLLLLLRYHLLAQAGYKEGRVSERVYSDSFDLTHSQRLIWCVYKIVTPLIILLGIAPISAVLFCVIRAPLVIVITALVIAAAIDYLCNDVYNATLEEIDCVSYRAKHCGAHIYLTRQAPMTYWSEPYKPQSYHTNLDAIACHTHIH